MARDGDEPDDATKLLYILTLAFRLMRVAIFLLGALAITRWGLLPIVKVVAGTDTNFNFSFGVNISIFLNVALGGGLVLSEVERRKGKKELDSRRRR